MATGIDLSPFWELLETNFPLAGPRCDLRTSLGYELVAALEAGGHLTFLRVADTVACPHPGGSGCPRQVIERPDGTFRAICGNVPPECDDVDLTLEDVEVLGVDTQRLCQALRGPLYTGGKVESVPGLRGVYRAGAFKPDTSIRHAVYFAARCNPGDYAAALEALRSQQEGESFAVLVPTDRFVNADTTRQMATLGIPVVPLRGVIQVVASGQLITSDDPLRVLGGTGRRTHMTSGPLVAQVRTQDGWQDLDEAGYQRLIETAQEYDILADEKARVVWKSGRREDGIRASHFRMIRAAVERTGRFDPGVDGPDDDQESGKQIFQRARQAIDVKYRSDDGTTQWRLFKSMKFDKHAEYLFQPDPGCRFALIFLPRS